VLTWRDVSQVPRDWGTGVVAIGVFDGVHLGHQTVLARARAAADDRGAKLVVVTFDPHPAAVVRPDQAPLMLTTLDTRLRLLAEQRVDATLVLTFDEPRSQQSAEEFVTEVLVDALHAVRIVVGANFRFGHKAAGDVALLEQMGALAGFDVDAVDLLATDAPVSSTRIRAAVAAGEVAAATELLGRPARVEGVVVRGDARGRELGYPTANVDVAADAAVPDDGVYAGWLVRADGTRLPAAVSIGTNPTFGGVERRVEAYVLDAHLDLYDERVAVEFVQRLRGMERFDSVDALISQMADDVEAARAALARRP
jgi:riboflavin kinase/FMN adenylyltransferase